MRDLEREIKNMEEESENVKTIRDSLPNFCPKIMQDKSQFLLTMSTQSEKIKAYLLYQFLKLT